MGQNPYYLDIETTYPEVILPQDLRIEGIQGRIIVEVKLDNEGRILKLEWIVLLLKNKDGNIFIDYRDAVSKSFEISDYPKPIRPYVKLMEEEIKKLKFKRDESLPKPKSDWFFRVPFVVM